ncbi:MAG: DUF3015 family protein [Halobacteriovoraceae bacterium]|jgi:hypothetical protein|nr:DUF3015 family protein [Halobacteriovoraceae bacterium]
MKKMYLSLLLLSLPFTSALAVDKSVGGCGLGWKVNSKHSWIGITTRVTTNSTTGPFGTTTGTSGCAKHSIVHNHKLDQHMAEASFDELMIEMAAGRGENLVAFSRALGCDDLHSGIFAQAIKANYSTISKEGRNPGQMLSSVRRIMAKNKQLERGCQLI